jgi:hypothetical protein
MLREEGVMILREINPRSSGDDEIGQLTDGFLRGDGCLVGWFAVRNRIGS